MLEECSPRKVRCCEFDPTHSSHHEHPQINTGHPIVLNRKSEDRLREFRHEFARDCWKNKSGVCCLPHQWFNRFKETFHDPDRLSQGPYGMWIYRNHAQRIILCPIHKGRKIHSLFETACDILAQERLIPYPVLREKRFSFWYLSYGPRTMLIGASIQKALARYPELELRTL